MTIRVSRFLPCRCPLSCACKGVRLGQGLALFLAVWLGPVTPEAQARTKVPVNKKAAAVVAAAEGTLVGCGKEVLVGPSAPPGAAKSAGPADRGCEVGMALAAGDRVRTGAEGMATIESRGARIWLDPASQLSLPGAGKAGKKGRGGLTLNQGAARIAFDPGPSKGSKPLLLQAQEAEVRIRGVLRVEVSPGELRVAVYDGQAEVVGKRGSVKLTAGRGAVVRLAGKAKGPAQNKTGGLLAAPTWEGQGQGVFFALPQKSNAPDAPLSVAADLSLPFHPVDGAVRYRLEIGRDEALIDRIFVGLLSAESKVAAARVLLRGRYFARLQAVDSDQVAGPGRVLPLEVVEVRGEQVTGESATLSAGLRRSRVPLLTGAGELAFDLVSAAGKLQVQVDGKRVSGEGGGLVPIKVGRGPHRVVVNTDAGERGELRVEVTRPSYAIDISQGPRLGSDQSDQSDRPSRIYRLEVHALDEKGRVVPGSESLQVRTGLVPSGEAHKAQQPVLAARTPAPESQRSQGSWAGDLEVPIGQTLRVTITDADGPVASADLAGSQDNQ